MSDIKITYNPENLNYEASFDHDEGFVYFLTSNGYWKYVKAPKNVVLGITTGNSTFIKEVPSNALIGAVEIALFAEIKIDNEYFSVGYLADTDSAILTSKISRKNATQAKDLINTIISNNQQILINNLIGARIITLAEQNGKNLPKEVYETIFSLQVRLQNRNNNLLTNSWLSGVQESKHEYFSKYSADLNRCVNSPKIGVVIEVSIVTVIVVSALASLVITSLLWYYFSDDADESKQDYEYSADFIDMLKKLTPEDAALAEKEVQDAYDEGYKLGEKKGGSFTTLLKAGAVFVALIIGENLISKRKNNGLAKL